MTAPYSSLYALRDEHSALLKRQRATTPDPELWSHVENLLARGALTGALLDREEDRQAAQDLLDYWVTALLRAGRNAPDSTLAGFDLSLAPEIPNDQCPYVGLDAFRPANARFFFGRQRLQDQILAHIAASRLLVVIGPSGSGKSSLVLAGVLPRLATDALPGSSAWRVFPTLLPGMHPIVSLAGVVRSLEQSELGSLTPEGAVLRANPNRLAQKILEHRTGPCLLVVDQFEELFTLCQDAGERQAFVDNLLSLVSLTDPVCRVILTLRSDFEPHLTALPALAERLQQAIVRIHPMEADELRESIERPAALVGLRFEAGLLDELVRQVRDEPAGLPLLQFTLHKLWQSRDRNRVTWAAFRQLGGVREALARSADALYERLIPEERHTMRRILLLLVQPGAGLEVTSRRLPRSQIYLHGEAEDRITRVLERLIAAGLLRQTCDENELEAQVEVAHEALVRNWERLVGWLIEERARLRARLRLTLAAEHWAESGRDAGLLLRGPKLHAALAQDDLRPLESEFVRESKQAADAEEQRTVKRQRTAFRVTMAFAIILVVCTAWALHAMRSAKHWQQQAETLLIENYEEQGRALFLEGKTARAYVYLREAERLGGNKPSLRFLLAAASPSLARRSLPAENSLSQPAGKTRFFALSADGKTLLTLAADGLLATWDLHSGKVVSERKALQLHGVKVKTATASRDLQILVVETEKGRLMWELADDSLTKLPSATAAAVSPDGTTLALATTDTNHVGLWDTKTGDFKRNLPHPETVKVLLFSPEGRRLLSAGADKIARLWDLESYKLLQSLEGHGDTITSAAFSRHGDHVLTGSADSTARRWAVVDAQTLNVYKGHSKAVTAVAYRADYASVLTASEDQTLRVHSVAGSPLLVLEGYRAPLVQAMYAVDGTSALTLDREGLVLQSPTVSTLSVIGWLSAGSAVTEILHDRDGKKVLWISADQSATLRDTDTHTLLGLWRLPRPIDCAALRPDGDSVALCSGDGVQVFHGGSRTPAITLPAASLAVAFSPDGSFLATGGSDGKLRLWDARHGKLLNTLGAEVGKVNSLVFSADGRQLLLANANKTALIVSVDTQAVQAEFIHSEEIKKALFSPSGDRVLTASEAGPIHLWDREKIQLMTTITEAAGSAVSFDPSGTMIVTASEDGAVDIWDQRGRRVAHYGHYFTFTALSVAAQSGQIVLGTKTQGLWVSSPFLAPVRTNLDDCVPFTLASGSLLPLQRSCSWDTSESVSRHKLIQQGNNLENNGNLAAHQHLYDAAQSLYDEAAATYGKANRPRMQKELLLNHAILAALRGAPTEEVEKKLQQFFQADREPLDDRKPEERAEEIQYQKQTMAIVAAQANELIGTESALILYDRLFREQKNLKPWVRLEYAEALLATGRYKQTFTRAKDLYFDRELKKGHRVIASALAWSALVLDKNESLTGEWKKQLNDDYQIQEIGPDLGYSFWGTMTALRMRPGTSDVVLSVLRLLSLPVTAESKKRLAELLELVDDAPTKVAPLHK